MITVTNDCASSCCGLSIYLVVLGELCSICCSSLNNIRDQQVILLLLFLVNVAAARLTTSTPPPPPHIIRFIHPHIKRGMTGISRLISPRFGPPTGQMYLQLVVLCMYTPRKQKPVQEGVQVAKRTSQQFSPMERARDLLRK